jgi:hypothetical protein
MSLRNWDEKDKYQGLTLTNLLHDYAEPGSFGWDEELDLVFFTNLGKLVA